MRDLMELMDHRGHCYRLASQYVLQHGGTYVVGKVASEGRPIYHAWVEKGQTIYEPEHDKEWPKSQFYDAKKADPLATYDKDSLALYIARNGGYPDPARLNLG